MKPRVASISIVAGRTAEALAELQCRRRSPRGATSTVAEVGLYQGHDRLPRTGARSADRCRSSSAHTPRPTARRQPSCRAIALCGRGGTARTGAIARRRVRPPRRGASWKRSRASGSRSFPLEHQAVQPFRPAQDLRPVCELDRDQSLRPTLSTASPLPAERAEEVAERRGDGDLPASRRYRSASSSARAACGCGG